MVNLNLMLHKLRNNSLDGKILSDNERRELMLQAADELELWKNAYENMRDFAVESGLDIVTTGRKI